MHVCVCLSMHSHIRNAVKCLILPVPSGHISCNRPSVKARQLTIRGGGGVCGMGDYQRLSIIHNHKAHTLTGLRAGISALACICLRMRAHGPTQKERRQEHCGTAQKRE